MKIRNINGMDQGLQGSRGIDPHEGSEARPLVFEKTLTTLSREQHEVHLQALIKDIDAQGAKLSKRADIKEFERYRQLIREFVDEIVSNGYAFSKDNAFEARGRHRVFATVKKLDEKLDALGKEVLEEQADNIEILHQIDDIRGLLVDMLL